MTELKFKVWNKSAKRMSPLNHLDMKTIIDHIKWKCGRIYLEETEWAKFLQFTGLQDKNGVGIYEGDIIRHVGSPTKYYTAKFDMIFGLRFIDSGEYYVMPISPVDRPQTSIEVIGNIYENPDLL